ncbi:erythroblast NAD(P)(+)--arginine ADP-ribosyltransferase-like [Numenius arquata]|uniref:erythroblast NAD(P)(+)--arginine ADP-ribosyltransferase-like n=1 Tax=Numenius arquata TaxID=31919 RepID=UPI003D30618C
MEYLVLGLVLLAGALAVGYPLQWQDLGPIKEMRLDMAPTSFDDQYQGCSHVMEEELRELNHTEFTNNRVYADYWTHATAKWQKKAGNVPKPPGMRAEHAVALMAYTLPGSLYQTFNAAVHEAGRSCNEYLYKFHFKTLHFLLTQALRILRNARPKCYQVYRGVQGIHFTARPQDLIRFGQFTFSSFLKSVAESYGQDTFFSVYTCYGVPIKNFSFYHDEDEVLIPPYERFVVINITKHGKRTYIQLQSKDTFSNYNCEWVKGKRCQDQPCDFNAGESGAPAANGEGDARMSPPCLTLTSPNL